MWFRPEIYRVFASEDYSSESDCFLAESMYRNGTSNIECIRADIARENMFQFDYRFKGISTPDLRRRMSRICQILREEKERIGMDMRVRQEKGPE